MSVLPSQQSEIHRGLTEGSLDLGLVNLLAGDDLSPEMDASLLLRGHVVVCLPPDHPLTALRSITRDDLAAEPMVVVRAGYVMHCFVYRFFDGEFPDSSFTMDGAEMGKLMVAEGLGLTLLPDFGIAQDPLERLGAIVTRPLAADSTEVSLYLQRLRTVDVRPSVAALCEVILARSREYQAELARAGDDSADGVEPEPRTGSLDP